MPRRLARVAVAVLLAVAASGCQRETRLDLGDPETVADGVVLYRLSDPAILESGGPIAAQILRLDPKIVRLSSVLANDRVMALETVPGMAARAKAVAAINAGFFVVRNGDPAGVLEVGDELVSETSLMRGAVGILSVPRQPVRLLFDRINVAATLRFTVNGDLFSVPIDGIDTTRARGKLMLYTPRFGPDTDTAAGGVEWQLAGVPRRVADKRVDAGKTRVPIGGAVLSFGGTVLPTALEQLNIGQNVFIDTIFQSAFGTPPESWTEAVDIVGGAGLLVYKGKPVADWSEEQLRDAFTSERHPRTMIGVSKGGTIWLVTVDGRNAQVSVGMTFAELQRLAQGLNLYHALNLDGGGSTTMVVNGTVVNHPSDPTGPRRVSDGIVVTLK